MEKDKQVSWQLISIVRAYLLTCTHVSIPHISEHKLTFLFNRLFSFGYFLEHFEIFLSLRIPKVIGQVSRLGYVL